MNCFKNERWSWYKFLTHSNILNIGCRSSSFSENKQLSVRILNSKANENCLIFSQRNSIPTVQSKAGPSINRATHITINKQNCHRTTPLTSNTYKKKISTFWPVGVGKCVPTLCHFVACPTLLRYDFSHIKEFRIVCLVVALGFVHNFHSKDIEFLFGLFFYVKPNLV